MAKLVYKTRGMVSSKGKPRIYFCCHPQDFATCFSRLSEEILERQDCAIWYVQSDEKGEKNGESENNGENEAFLEDLTEMQLFVIPVTARLLTEPSCARDKEIPLAIENHIPVLPVIMESGVEKDYSKIFGDLQYMDPQEKDPTALEYGEKLDTFLAAVLVGGELAEKVRKAFDAYIFLSYRKKDRIYARQLMRLIHQNDFCRDIAIWYDEFLRPGEDFNDAICEALQKSHLFVLTVTPNLTSEPNYIRTIEYPMARQEQKPILPVEMIPTDQELLAQQYEHIPPCADGIGGNGFSELLADAFTGIALREKDSSPEHRFFIGLAYLSGIDVEVDHVRAEELIRSAAEEGLEEAVRKLVAMYRNGDGVARDYRQAAHWQKILTENLAREYEGHHTTEHALRYLKESRVLGELVYESRHINQTMDILTQAAAFGEDLWECRNDEEFGDETALCYDFMGNVCRAEELLNDAMVYYEKALNIRERLVQEAPTIKRRRAIAVSCYRLGEWHRTEGNHTKAREYYHREHELVARLAKEDTSVDWHRDLLICYGALGDMDVAEHRYDDGIGYLTKALEIAREREAEQSTRENQIDLSITYDKLGFACQWSGRATLAEQYYTESYCISHQILEEDPCFENQRSVVVTHYNLGTLFLQQGDTKKARVHALDMVKLSEEMSETTGSIEARKYLMTGYQLIGDIHRKESSWPEAMTYYKKAEDILRQLAEETNDEDVLAAMKESL